MKCPRCGAEMIEGYRRTSNAAGAAIEVPLEHVADGWHCLRNQLAAKSAECEKLREFVKKRKVECENSANSSRSSSPMHAEFCNGAAYMAAQIEDKMAALSRAEGKDGQ